MSIVVEGHNECDRPIIVAVHFAIYVVLQGIIQEHGLHGYCKNNPADVYGVIALQTVPGYGDCVT